MSFDIEKHRMRMGALSTRISIRNVVKEELEKFLDCLGEDELDSMTHQEILFYFVSWIENETLNGFIRE